MITTQFECDRCKRKQGQSYDDEKRDDELCLPQAWLLWTVKPGKYGKVKEYLLCQTCSVQLDIGIQNVMAQRPADKDS